MDKILNILDVLDILFNVIFTIEMLLKFFALGKRVIFFFILCFTFCLIGWC